MYIINTTFVIEPAVHDKWYNFITTKVLPQITEQGFEVLAFTRVLHDTSQGHYTYSVQVLAEDIPHYQRFLTEIMDEYSPMAKNLFGELALHITTLLKKIPLN